MKKLYYCYILIDPRNLEPIYVGKGHNNRCNSHFRKCLKETHNNKKLENKVRKIYRETQLKPTIKKLTLQSYDENAILGLEKMFIWHYRNEGYNLCNLTDGGDGVSGYIWSEESKEKLHKSIENMSEENRKKMREANLGKKRGCETKRKMSESHKGLNHNEETKRKMSEKAKNMSVEHKNKLSIKSRGENNGASKINQETAYLIKKLLINHTISEISSILNVSGNIIKHIKYNQSWTHVII